MLEAAPFCFQSGVVIMSAQIKTEQQADVPGKKKSQEDRGGFLVWVISLGVHAGPREG